MSELTPGVAGPAMDDPKNILAELLAAVTSIYGTQTKCIPATALLVDAAAHFEITLRPQPVSIWSGDPQGQSATGRPGHEFGLAAGAKVRSSVPAAVDEWFHEVGHLVAIWEAGAVLLDPTFGQFGRVASERQSVWLELTDLADAPEPWAASDGTWHVCYWPVEQPDSWKDHYSAARDHLVPLNLNAVVSYLEGRINGVTPEKP